jgi:hypothetical protein
LKKNPSQKRAGGVAQTVGPEFKSQYNQKKKKRLVCMMGREKLRKPDPVFHPFQGGLGES